MATFTSPRTSTPTICLQAVPRRVQFKPHHLRKAVSGFAKRRVVICNRTAEYVPFILQPPSTAQFQAILLNEHNGLHHEALIQLDETNNDYSSCSGCVPPESSVGLIIKFRPPQVGEEAYLFHNFQDSLYCHISGQPSVEIKLTAAADAPQGESKTDTKTATVVFPSITQLPQQPPTSVYPTPPSVPAQRLTADALAFTNNWNDTTENATQHNTSHTTTRQATQQLPSSYQPSQPSSQPPPQPPPQQQTPQPQQRPSSSSNEFASKRQTRREGHTDSKVSDLFGGDGRGMLSEGGGFEIVTDNATMDEMDFYRNVISRGQETQQNGNGTTSPTTTTTTTTTTTIPSAPPQQMSIAQMRQTMPRDGPVRQEPAQRRNIVQRIDSVDDARSIVERMRARHSSTMSTVGSRIVEQKFASTTNHTYNTSSTSTISQQHAATTTNPLSSRNATRNVTNTRHSNNSNNSNTGISLAEFDTLVSNSRTTRRMQRDMKRNASTTTVPSGATIDNEEMNFYRSHMTMETRRRDDLTNGNRGTNTGTGGRRRSNNPYRDLVETSGARGRAARVDRHIERYRPEVARLKELSQSPVRKGRRSRAIPNKSKRRRRGGKRSRDQAPAPPKSGELSDYWSTMNLPDVDSSDDEEEEGQAARKTSSAVERLEWESLRTEMTIAEMNAERDMQATLQLENPEDDTSSDDERCLSSRGTCSGNERSGIGMTTSISYQSDELDFYKSLILPQQQQQKTNAKSASHASYRSEEDNTISATSNNKIVGNGPPSPLVRAMMRENNSEDEIDDAMNDERWLAIDQSGDYMKEYEKELRRTLQQEMSKV